MHYRKDPYGLYANLQKSEDWKKQQRDVDVRLEQSVGPSLSNRKPGVQRVEGELGRAGALSPARALQPTGHYDNELEHSVKTYQQRAGLKVDGILHPGGPTAAALSQKKSRNIFPKRPVSLAIESGNWRAINSLMKTYDHGNHSRYIAAAANDYGDEGKTEVADLLTQAIKRDKRMAISLNKALSNKLDPSLHRALFARAMEDSGDGGDGGNEGGGAPDLPDNPDNPDMPNDPNDPPTPPDDGGDDPDKPTPDLPPTPKPEKNPCEPLEQKVEELEKEEQGNEETIKEIEQDTASTKASIEETEHQLKEAEKERDRLEKLITDEVRENEKEKEAGYNEDLAEKYYEMAKRRASQEEKIAGAAKKLRKWHLEFLKEAFIIRPAHAPTEAALKEKLDMINDKILSLKQALRDQEAKLKDLEKELTATKGENERLRHELAVAKEKLAECRSRNA